jgi:hypothetical protein
MQDIINEANDLFTWLWGRRIIDWRGLLTTNFPANEANKHIATAKKTSVKVHGIPQAEPHGALAMNLSQAVDECFDFILPSHVDSVMELLKSNRKLVQFGRGKGKVLVLINPVMLAPNTVIDGLDPTNPAHLAKAVAAAGQDVEVLTKEVLRLKKELEYKTARVSELQEQVNITYRTTWT